MKELSKKDLEKYLMFLLSRESGKLVQITTSNSPILVSFPEIAILAEWTMYPEDTTFINIRLAIMSGDKYKLNLITGTCSADETRNMKVIDILYNPKVHINGTKTSFTVTANLAGGEYGLNESNLSNNSISQITEDIASFYNKTVANKSFRASKYDIMRTHDEPAVERIKLIIAGQKSKKKSSDNMNSNMDEAMKDASIRKFINAIDAHITELNVGVSIVRDLATGEECAAFIISIDDISLPTTNASADIIVAVTDHKCMIDTVVRDHSSDIHDKKIEFIILGAPIIDMEGSSVADIKIRSERVESVVDHIIKGVINLHVDMLEKYKADKNTKGDNNKLSDEKKNEDLKCEYEKSMDDLIVNLIINTGERLGCNFSESINPSSLRSPNLGPIPNVNIKNLYPQFFGRMIDSKPLSYDTFDGDILYEVKLNKKKPW